MTKVILILNLLILTILYGCSSGSSRTSPIQIPPIEFTAFDREEMTPQVFSADSEDTVSIYKKGLQTELVIENIRGNNTATTEYFFYGTEIQATENSQSKTIQLSDNNKNRLAQIIHVNTRDENGAFDIYYVDELGEDRENQGFIINNIFPIQVIHNSYSNLQTDRKFTIKDG